MRPTAALTNVRSWESNGLNADVAGGLFQLFSLCHRSTLQRRRKTSTRANRSAAIRKPAISFVARPLISGVLNGRGGHPSVTPTSFCRVAGLTVATCHAALHAALADARVLPSVAPSHGHADT